MANKIYRGPVQKEPQTINLPVAGAYLPGILVTSNGSTLTVGAVADMGEKLYALANRDFYGQDVATAYASGDTGVAYEILPGELYQLRLAAGTYAYGDELTIGASGYLTAAADSPDGDVVYGYFQGTAGTFDAGDLADIRIASMHTKYAA